MPVRTLPGRPPRSPIRAAAASDGSGRASGLPDALVEAAGDRLEDVGDDTPRADLDRGGDRHPGDEAGGGRGGGGGGAGWGAGAGGQVGGAGGGRPRRGGGRAPGRGGRLGVVGPSAGGEG